VNDRLRHAAALPADWEERTNILDEADALAGLDAEEREEIAATRAALARVGEGTYGRCARCHRPIAEARLRALPLAITCVSCAAG
ncbi:MAG: TraR/DksA family transcriptional regulator, partial [Myxococcota bacterium]